MRSVSLLLMLLAYPLISGAANKEMVELQRDMASLQDQVKTLQRTLDEKLATLAVLVQQSLDSGQKTNTSVAVLQSAFADQLRQQEKNVVAPVVGVGSKIDQLAEEFRFVKEGMKDLNSRMDRLQTQVTDVRNAITVITAPPPPPPSANQPTTGAAPSGPPPGVSADQLYQNAYRDYSSGNEMAMQEFNDFLRFFPTMDLAANAQYYIGMISFNKSDFDGALAAFEAVNAKYGPGNNKASAAMFMKGRTLLKMGQKTAAADQFLEVIKKFPESDEATKAKAERKQLGFSSAAPPRGTTTKKRR